MTDPAAYTDPAWAAKEARRLALEEAAAVADTMVANRERVDDKNGVRIAHAIAFHIRALAKEPG